MPNFGRWYKAAVQKAENLQNDFDEIAATIWEMGWGDRKKLTKLWLEKKKKKRVREGGQVLSGFLSLDVVRLGVWSVVRVSGSFGCKHLCYGYRVDSV